MEEITKNQKTDGKRHRYAVLSLFVVFVLVYTVVNARTETCSACSHFLGAADLVEASAQSR